jgi:hypothetical protein
LRWKKNAHLCVLGDLCGRTFLTSVRSKRSMIGVGIGIGIGIERPHDETRLCGGISHRDHRVHREILLFAIDEITPTSAGIR